MGIFVSRNIFRVHLSIMICTSRILWQQKLSFEQIYSKAYKPEHSPNTWWNYSTTCMMWPQTCEPTTGTRGYSWISYSRTNHWQSFWVRYISSTRLPYVALLSLGDTHACLAHVALMLALLLQHTNVSFPLHPFHVMHTTQCTLREMQQLLLRNITHIHPSLHSYPSTLLLRLMFIICTVHNAPLLHPLDTVHTDLG
jgi:hypothetical protein